MVSYSYHCSAYILGAAISLAFAPLNLSFILIPSFTTLLFLIRNQSPKKAFIFSWLFGFGHFSVSLYWIYFAFEIVNLSYLGPFAVMGLAMFIAIFPALSGSLTTLWSRNSVQQVWLFSGLWCLMEWLRSYIFTGFPWNLIGYTWGITMLQSTAWIGIYGLSFFTILWATSFASRSWKMIFSSTLIIVSLWTIGYIRLQQTSTLEYKDTNIRLVQASIPQQLKWLPEEREKNLSLYLTLSKLEAERPLKAIIWTEAAVTFPINKHQNIRDILKTIVPPNGIFITGGIRLIDTASTDPIIFNTLFVLDKTGQILDIYDKKQLTPFGEYVPFRSILTIEKLTYGSIDYKAGTESKVLKVDPLPPFQPLICYEGIFPHLIIRRNSGAAWFLSLTNDSWFGLSWGPYQHLAIVRARAIEHGIPLIRAASNGISAVIDPYGRILHRLELNEIGFIDFTLPQPLVESTFYSHWREIPFFILLAFSLIIGSVTRFKGETRNA
jgi:apolipoprotein N-acyltransferase